MAEIDHVVVLMRENRSFDHMHGFLDHPDSSHDGIRQGRPTPPARAGPAMREGSETNLLN